MKLYYVHPVDLVDRMVYVLQSRNLLVGVYRASTQGFIGVREKFDSKYLFEEGEFDLQHGTARAKLPVFMLPEGIEAKEHVLLDDPDHPGRKTYETYAPLFDLLLPLDEEQAGMYSRMVDERPRFYPHPDLALRLPSDIALRNLTYELRLRRRHGRQAARKRASGSKWQARLDQIQRENGTPGKRHRHDKRLRDLRRYHLKQIARTTP